MSTVSDLEQQLKAQKLAVENRDLALKLSNVPAFRKLILDEFCVQEAARYVQTSGDPALTEAQRADALNIAQASGHLKRWLSVQVLMGNVAANNIIDIENAIEEARLEEDQPVDGAE